MGSFLNGHDCQALLPRFKGISAAPEIGGAASLLILTNRALSNTVFGIMSEKITNSILNGGAGSPVRTGLRLDSQLNGKITGNSGISQSSGWSAPRCAPDFPRHADKFLFLDNGNLLGIPDDLTA